jgi:putative aldouronate transport system substrate-binding protein
MKSYRKWIAASVALGLVLSTGCAKPNQPAPSMHEAESPPLEITWTAIMHTQQPPSDTILKELERLTNTKLSITWIPDAIKEGKLKSALTSNTLTKIVTIQNMKSPDFIHGVQSGWFWEIGPYLSQFPNLSRMNPNILENTAISGKIYGIYRERPLSRQGVILRKDWLERLGMEPPSTIDELYQVLKAFTLNDPDGNGVHDTYGLAERNDLTFGAFKTLSSYFNTPNEWGLKDGRLLPEFMFDEYIETMKFMRKLYQEGLMNDDFALASKNQQWEKFYTSKAGVYIGNMVDASNLYQNAQKHNYSMNLEIINRIAGPDGQHRVWSQGGHNGIFVFPKDTVETEEELKKLLGFFERLAAPELWNLMNLGIRDVHYRVVDDYYFEYMKEAASLREQEVRPLLSLVGLDASTLMAYGDPLSEKYDALTKDNQRIVVPNPVESISSPMFTDKGPELHSIINNATYHFILGQIDEKGFQLAVERWLAGGGDVIIQEYNQEYARRR